MPNSQEKLSGVFAPVVTPFVDESVSLDHLRSNLRRLVETPLRGYLALGSNGEFKSLTEREQLDILEVFAAEKGDKTVMVGTGCESTKETIERSRIVAQMGFDFVSVLTPHYFAKRIDGPTLLTFYERIAESISIPVMLYNAPGFAGGVAIPPVIVAKLGEHPNIAGIKDSSPAGPAKFLALLDPADDFHVLAGSADFLYPSLFLGAAGGVLSLANALPAPCCELYEAFRAGRFQQARDLHFRLARLNSAVSGAWGVAGVKAAMDVVGLKGGAPRHPLAAVDDGVRETIRRKIVNEGFSVE